MSASAGLLCSHPYTIEEFAGEGLCLGMGILGRNKGLNPQRLVINMTAGLSKWLGNTSAWNPRPSKARRSYYITYLRPLYHGIGESYINAAVELCLLLHNADEPAIRAWLQSHCEQQSYTLNKAMVQANATQPELAAHYESSYVSMIMSLNYMKDEKLGGTTTKAQRRTVRT